MGLVKISLFSLTFLVLSTQGCLARTSRAEQLKALEKRLTDETQRDSQRGIVRTCRYKCPNGADPLPRANHVPSMNGCGSYGVTIEFMDEVEEVKACCDIHDACYEICNKPQKECDAEFRDCLHLHCNSDDPDTRAACSAVSSLSYLAVSVLGCGSWKGAQEKGCYCPEV